MADVIGYEWDNTKLVFQGFPVWTEGASNIPRLDREGLQIIFEGPVYDVAGVEGTAQAVFFESDAGAKVFSAGTIRWAWGLRKPGFIEAGFQVLNENLILHFLE